VVGVSSREEAQLTVGGGEFLLSRVVVLVTLLVASSVSSSYSSPPWLGAVKNLFAHQSSPSPSDSPRHCPFTPVEPGYGVDLYEDEHLLLLAADLRMDPALRPRPVSSVAFACLGNAYNSITRLNDGIFTVHRFSVATSAKYHNLK
jgi:hypothetical protein